LDGFAVALQRPSSLLRRLRELPNNIEATVKESESDRFLLLKSGGYSKAIGGLGQA